MRRDYGDGATDYVTDNTLHAGRLRRYATWPVHHQQNIGEHCWQIYRIYDSLFGRPSSDVAYTIMNHDTPELTVGDPPFPLKAQNPDLKEIYTRLETEAEQRYGIIMPHLPQQEMIRVKICDLLEMMEFGFVELQMGNQFAHPIIERTAVFAKALADKWLDDFERKRVYVHIIGVKYRHEQVMYQTVTTGPQFVERNVK